MHEVLLAQSIRRTSITCLQNETYLALLLSFDAILISLLKIHCLLFEPSQVKGKLEMLRGKPSVSCVDNLGKSWFNTLLIGLSVSVVALVLVQALYPDSIWYRRISSRLICLI